MDLLTLKYFFLSLNLQQQQKYIYICLIQLDGNYTRMLRAILNKSWKQHPTKQHGHPLPISKTIQIRRTRHAGLYWRNKDQFISDVLKWTSSHGRASVGRTVRAYLPQLCPHTGCSLEDQPEAMDDKDTWRERVRETRASSTTWWYIYIEREGGRERETESL